MMDESCLFCSRDAVFMSAVYRALRLHITSTDLKWITLHGQIFRFGSSVSLPFGSRRLSFRKLL